MTQPKVHKTIGEPSAEKMAEQHRPEIGPQFVPQGQRPPGGDPIG